jgi:hypothetical protein
VQCAGLQEDDRQRTSHVRVSWIDVGYALEGGQKDCGMPRLRSVTQGCSGPCKGPCFDNVLEGRDVSVKVVWVLDSDN